MQNGLQDLLESMMVSERREYLRENSASGNKCNGFRPRHSYGHGSTPTSRIPRDRYGRSHPRILAILLYQEDECERLAGSFTRKVLRRSRSARYSRISTCGKHYSKANILRILDYLREDVSQWLTRSLEAYYPILIIDCVRMKIHRKRSVETEAFYVCLPCVKTSGVRYWGSSTSPRSALGWGEMLTELHERDVRKIGLVCADGLKGLMDVINAIFPDTPLQRCALKHYLVDAAI